MLPNGKYVTELGSTVEISGDYGGVVGIDFDWVEEGGCIDCAVFVEHFDFGESQSWLTWVCAWLTWVCENCGGGYAKLKRID